MRRDLIEYLSDTVLIEKMSEMESSELAKEAGLFNELGLNSVASSIKNTFRGKTFLDIMAPGVLFKIHPIFSLIYFVAQKFLGFDINSVISSIMGKLRPKLESEGQVTADEVNSAGKEVISSLGGSMQATANDSLLAHLYDLDNKGFFKEAYRTPSRIKFFGSRTGSRWASVFGDLLKLPRRGKLVWLIGGIIIWTLKTALLGAGLLAGASALSGVVGDQEEEEDGDDHAQEEEAASSSIQKDMPSSSPPSSSAEPTSRPKSLPLLIRDPFRASGWGQKHFPNNKNNVWVVPLINRSIDDTLLTWTIKVYPELSGKEHIIESTTSFQDAVDDMNKNFDPTSDTFSVPERVNNKNVHSVKDVVDTFAKEVARRIKG